MTDQEKQTQEAFERVNEALGSVAESLQDFAQKAEAAMRTLEKLKYFYPIPVEGKVE